MTLATYLKKAKLTQAEFAEASGLSQGHVSRLLRGKNFPDYGTMLVVARTSLGNVLPVDWPRAAKRRRAAA